MTTAQRWIYEYVKQTYGQERVSCSLVGGNSVKVTDRKGESEILTVNLFGDIMNAKTKEICAVSDAPHDLDKLARNPHTEPTVWKKPKIKM